MNITETRCTLGQDPEYKVTKNGAAFVTTSVAVSNDYKDKNGEWVKRDPMWYKVKFVGNTVDNASLLTKGTTIKILGGKYEARSYKNKDGEWVNWHEVVVFEFEEVVYDNQ